MKLNQRQEDILKVLKENGQVRTVSLAKNLFASEMTIRRDLKFLENEGLLTRCHGGALPIGNQLFFPIKYRMLVNDKEKKALALSAKKYLCDDATIFFNSSSTCAFLIPYLREYKNIRVVTNSLFLTSLLAPLNIPCTITGGDFVKGEDCLCGNITESFLRNIHPDISFLSCEGFSHDFEITESKAEMAQIEKIAIKNSRLTVFLIDSSKNTTVYTHSVCRANENENVVIITK